MECRSQFFILRVNKYKGPIWIQ